MKHHFEMEAICAEGRLTVDTMKDGVRTNVYDSVADEAVKAKLADLLRLESTAENQKDLILRVLARWDAYTEFFPKVKGRLFCEIDFEWPDDTVVPWDVGPPTTGIEIGVFQPVMELQALRTQARELVAAGERG